MNYRACDCAWCLPLPLGDREMIPVAAGSAPSPATLDDVAAEVAALRAEINALLPDPYRPFAGFTEARNAVKVAL